MRPRGRPPPGDAMSGLLPLVMPEELQEASRLLRACGIHVACGGPSLVVTRTFPLDGIEYRHVLSGDRGDAPAAARLVSTFRDGTLRVLVYEPTNAEPAVEVEATPDGTTVTVRDGSVFPRVVVGMPSAAHGR